MILGTVLHPVGEIPEQLLNLETDGHQQMIECAVDLFHKIGVRLSVIEEAALKETIETFGWKENENVAGTTEIEITMIIGITETTGKWIDAACLRQIGGNKV